MIGLGCMRLSTEPDRDETRARAVIAAAIAGGVELFDTADAYGLDDGDVGHNERLLAGSPGMLVTKGGLERTGGTWHPNGRARHLAAAATASRERLGRIDLYLLHAVDPAVPLATSVRALAKLREAGVARAIGLSNVNVTQLEGALAITPIDGVEVELNPWKLDAVRGGLVAACTERSIRMLAHRPLGGPAGVKRAAKDPVLRELAERLAATPVEIVLAWLRSLSPMIVTLPGATRVETVASAIRGQRLALDDDARAALAGRFLEIGRAAPRHANQEVVMILGMPAAGKTTLALDHVARGYVRLNRDERGGSLLDLARALDRELAAGATKLVVDNTYPTRASRAPILDVARRHGASVRCIVVATTLEDAQGYAVARLLERHGSLEHRSEIRPGVQFRWRREYEPPRADEGFLAIEAVTPPRLHTGTRAGLVVELDGIVWDNKPLIPSKIVLLDGVSGALAAWRDHPIGATLWRPGASPDAIAALAARLCDELGCSIDVRYCAHPAGPPICWCRKPLPGLALALARAHDLDPSRTIHLGKSPADRGFALRAGMRFATVEDGWPVPDA